MWSNEEHFKVVDRFESELFDMRVLYESKLRGADEAAQQQEVLRLRATVDYLKAEKQKIRHDTNIEIGATNRTAQMFNERNIELKTENDRLKGNIFRTDSGIQEALADMIAHSKNLSLKIRVRNHALMEAKEIFVELENSEFSGSHTSSTAWKGKGVVDAALDA